MARFKMAIPHGKHFRASRCRYASLIYAELGYISIFECDSSFRYSDYSLIEMYNSSNTYQQGFAVGLLNTDELPDVVNVGWMTISTMINNTAINTSIEFPNQGANGICIYPNPNEGDFVTSLSPIWNPPLRILIFNNQGKVIYSKVTSEHLNSINLSVVKSGLYLIQVIDSHNRQVTKKLIIL